MSDWESTTLGSVLALQRGHDLTDQERKPGFIPVIGSAGANGFHAEAKAAAPGVTIGRSGASAGVVTFVTQDYWPHNTCLYVTDFQGNDPRFCYYWLKNLPLSEYNSGSAQPSLNRNYLYNIAVSVPRLSEQRTIALVLGSLDDKIDLNRRMNETLEAMARAIFKDWFVDFGPTRAKMEGRAPYLSPDVWSLFPDRLDDEGKPEGWVNGTLATMAELNPESWSSRTMPSEIEYLDLSGCKNGDVHEVQSIRREHAPSRAQRILRSGDSVIGTVRPGNRSFALIGRDGFTGSTGFAVLRPKRKSYRDFVYLSVTAEEAIAFFAHRADGAAYPAIRPDVVVDLASIWPGDRCLAAFDATVTSLIDRTLLNRIEARTLGATRDLLLPKLMSGEICINEAEREVAAAL